MPKPISADAAGKWLTGDEPFTAKLHPLMRLMATMIS